MLLCELFDTPHLCFYARRDRPVRVSLAKMFLLSRVNELFIENRSSARSLRIESMLVE